MINKDVEIFKRIKGTGEKKQIIFALYDFQGEVLHSKNLNEIVVKLKKLIKKADKTINVHFQPESNLHFSHEVTRQGKNYLLLPLNEQEILEFWELFNSNKEEISE